MSYIQKGFTLVELAIALMVIGLLIGGVLKGQELIENAKITAYMRQVKAYDTAALIFKNTYGGLPGDMKRPNRIPDCNDTICNIAGNGNGKVAFIGDSIDPNYNTEEWNFFPHLTKAGMISNATTGVQDVDSMHVKNNPELVFPETAFGYYLGVESTEYIMDGKNYYALPSRTLINDTDSISVQAMIAIDTKFDDGKSSTGDIQTGTEMNVCPIYWDAETETYDYDATMEPSGCTLVISTTF